jgi:HEAT repeat protein
VSWFGGPPDVARLKQRRDLRGLSKALRFRRGTPAGYDPMGSIHSAARSGGGVLNLGFDDGYSVRSMALDALVEIGSDAVPVLIEALDDQAEDVRRSASEALVRVMDRRAVEPLYSRLDDWVIAENAVAVLAHFHDDRAIKPLLHRIGKAKISSRQDPHNSMIYFQEWQKATGLLRLFGPVWPPIGLACLSEKALPLRVGAAFAFGYASAGESPWPDSGGPEVARALVDALDDPDLVMKETAAYALASFARSATGPSLAEAIASKLDDPQHRWSIEAASYLARAVAVIGAPGTHACVLRVALEMTRSEDRYHRREAIEILELVRSPEATRLLRDLSIKPGNNLSELRTRAQEALKRRSES